MYSCFHHLDDGRMNGQNMLMIAELHQYTSVHVLVFKSLCIADECKEYGTCKNINFCLVYMGVKFKILSHQDTSMKQLISQVTYLILHDLMIFLYCRYFQYWHLCVIWKTEFVTTLNVTPTQFM